MNEGAGNRAFIHAGKSGSSITIVAIAIPVVTPVPAITILVPDFSGVAIPGKFFPGPGLVV
ncbi:MAG: hypothetical protein A2580_13090 [Hydrogenophilales bacterium RIFOXYD1_FULL_62_11]|nr:MAG: hypothetical protein A2580_13090 [Hydrogenophilales bacterium RIFOXYD1_FULL_62_11]